MGLDGMGGMDGLTRGPVGALIYFSRLGLGSKASGGKPRHVAAQS
jgi:hypothetical protein